jgi:hypothetical protein
MVRSNHNRSQSSLLALLLHLSLIISTALCFVSPSVLVVGLKSSQLLNSNNAPTSILSDTSIRGIRSLLKNAKASSCSANGDDSINDGNQVNGKKGGLDRSDLKDAEEWLDAAVQYTEETVGFDESSFLVGILGDLHMDPRKLEDYEQGRDHWLPIFDRAKQAHGNVAMVSLGDLGESKNCDHNENNPTELFA